MPTKTLTNDARRINPNIDITLTIVHTLEKPGWSKSYILNIYTCQYGIEKSICTDSFID